jgi:hypothetical protein
MEELSTVRRGSAALESGAGYPLSSERMTQLVGLGLGAL